MKSMFYFVIDHSVTVDSSLFLFGYNQWGQLGRENQELNNEKVFVPVQVPMDSIQNVFAGGWNTTILKSKLRAEIK